ncbi:MAG: hypothetical protein HKN88_05495 [Gammaproteobacteria bacterium]|nr:hypothetical protein [Gammaproteobacteria bacterium]NNC97508.1 hypothetical protein [Gammaproteobacteria bacterium]NNM14224.1 hypothetical protein [Gammaproteobacteria bacterium]
MLKKLITGLHDATKIKEYIGQRLGIDQEGLTPSADEFDLLAKNTRIVDYTKYCADFSEGLKLGIYQDTQMYLTRGLEMYIATENIHRVLDSIGPVYRELLNEKYNTRCTHEFLAMYSKTEFQRLQKMFRVTGLSFTTQSTETELCLNLLLRPVGKPFMVIGKPPKGKKSGVDYWEKTDAQLKRGHIGMYVDSFKS